MAYLRLTQGLPRTYLEVTSSIPRTFLGLAYGLLKGHLGLTQGIPTAFLGLTEAFPVADLGHARGNRARDWRALSAICSIRPSGLDFPRPYLGVTGGRPKTYIGPPWDLAMGYLATAEQPS